VIYIQHDGAEGHPLDKHTEGWKICPSLQSANGECVIRKLETDSLGGNPVLRRLKDNEEIRPLSANRNTIKAMEQRGLISPGKGRAHSLSCGVKKKID
jgi:hypothetical protein